MISSNKMPLGHESGVILMAIPRYKFFLPLLIPVFLQEIMLVLRCDGPWHHNPEAWGIMLLTLQNIVVVFNVVYFVVALSMYHILLGRRGCREHHQLPPLILLFCLAGYVCEIIGRHSLKIQILAPWYQIEDACILAMIAMVVNLVYRAYGRL